MESTIRNVPVHYLEKAFVCRGGKQRWEGSAALPTARKGDGILKKIFRKNNINRQHGESQEPCWMERMSYHRRQCLNQPLHCPSHSPDAPRRTVRVRVVGLPGRVGELVDLFICYASATARV